MTALLANHLVPNNLELNTRLTEKLQKDTFIFQGLLIQEKVVILNLTENELNLFKNKIKVLENLGLKAKYIKSELPRILEEVKYYVKPKNLVTKLESVN